MWRVILESFRSSFSASLTYQELALRSRYILLSLKTVIKTIRQNNHPQKLALDISDYSCSLLVVQHWSHYSSMQEIACTKDVCESNCQCHIFFICQTVSHSQVGQRYWFFIFFLRSFQRCSCHIFLCVCNFHHTLGIILSSQTVYLLLKINVQGIQANIYFICLLY